MVSVRRMRSRRPRPSLLLLAAAVLPAACGRTDAEVRADAAPTPPTFDAAAWRPPGDDEIPDDALGASIRRGRALVRHTPDSLPAYAPGRIACTNCHLDDGRAADAPAMAGAYARYPKHLPRSGAVIDAADRVNFCLTRSLAGRPLPHESREMEDILAYLAFLARGVPFGSGHLLRGAQGMRSIPGADTLRDPYPGDSARGALVYAAECAACHGADGAGRDGDPTRAPEAGGRVPALWGPRSYSIGASMARQERAASFIWHNMPLGRPRTLTLAQAYDVAAYVNAHPRPDLPGKADDWPQGDAPKDVPYTLNSGHRAFRPPPLLPRAHGDQARVPVPPRVAAGTR